MCGAQDKIIKSKNVNSKHILQAHMTLQVMEQKSLVQNSNYVALQQNKRPYFAF